MKKWYAILNKLCYNSSMKKYVLLLGLVLSVNSCLAFDVVYPKRNETTINSNSTFFIGSSDKPLKINGQDIPLHETGAFAYVVKLQNGSNTFTLQTDDERQIFVINKPIIKTECNLPLQFFKYPEIKYFYVTTEGSPLRSTPIDAGINRMAHLQRNINLLIDGEKGGFYRVILGDNQHGWIAKTNVKQFSNFEITPATMSGYDYIDSDEFFTFIFHLDKKVPFEIIENNPLLIKFFNVKDNENNIYTMDLPLDEMMDGKKLIGYSGEYQGNDFVLKIRKPLQIHTKKPLKNIKIAIDAGHGGNETGAIGCLGDKEKDINLSIAKFLEKDLTKKGAKVIMTRDDDIYIGLKDRVDIANREDAAIFISIHCNALPDGADPNKNTGTSIYYYYNQAKPLADDIINSVVSELGINNDKVRQGSLAVVRNTNALSLLIETSYLINPQDNANLINLDFQEQYAKAITDALEKYIQE